jgi:hypothetical protein
MKTGKEGQAEGVQACPGLDPGLKGNDGIIRCLN